MKIKRPKQDIIFDIFISVTVFLSVYSFALLSKLQGEPNLKMFTDILIIFLLFILNTAVVVLYEEIKRLRKK